ncbi:hypothetical protein L873DRAFT_481219 [Choiromyces venosus 120613-1]|uniref:Uncharacterized protein n=1 Tax=Choiromyces venosus 120613-1 TaxID=1336337 RepID=A0A3N4K7Y3_9PEZI|nr:hypothetical protein L873DRAFT_481219 [Choiromyces venosus 120613-1]
MLLYSLKRFSLCDFVKNRVFSIFLDTFILRSLLQFDYCVSVSTRHATPKQNSVLLQTSIIRVKTKVWRGNQTHPRYRKMKFSCTRFFFKILLP